jgi:hypothetical protein
MAKEIVFDTDKLAAGVDKLANAVKITMGPKGRTVVIEKSYGAPVATKDGVTVAKAVSLKDPGENIGARMVQEVAKKAGDDAGDHGNSDQGNQGRGLLGHDQHQHDDDGQEAQYCQGNGIHNFTSSFSLFWVFA